MVEREGAAYGGYGGVYVHDYGGPLMQNEQKLPNDRRDSRSQFVESGRSSRSDTSSLPTPTYPIPNNFHPSEQNIPPDECRPVSMGWSYPLPPQGIPRVSDMYQNPLPYLTADKYTQMHRNIYSPLNNEPTREKLILAPVRKPPDLTVINNTIGESVISQKHSNTITNYPGMPPQMDPNVISNRDIDPRLRGTRVYPSRNISIDNSEPRGGRLVEERSSRRSSHDFDDTRKDDDRDYTRTISRAHLRRDSFGEVASRRSPSHESPAPESSSASYSDPPPPLEDSWNPAHHPRRAPSQESLQHQVSVSFMSET